MSEKVYCLKELPFKKGKIDGKNYIIHDATIKEIETGEINFSDILNGKKLKTYTNRATTIYDNYIIPDADEKHFKGKFVNYEFENKLATIEITIFEDPKFSENDIKEAQGHVVTGHVVTETNNINAMPEFIEKIQTEFNNTWNKKFLSYHSAKNSKPDSTEKRETIMEIKKYFESLSGENSKSSENEDENCKFLKNEDKNCKEKFLNGYKNIIIYSKNYNKKNVEKFFLAELNAANNKKKMLNKFY